MRLLLQIFRWLMPCFKIQFGSGGGGGSNQGTNKFDPPLWTVNQFPDFVQAASTISTQPRQEYYGQRIPALNDTQVQGMNYLAALSGNMSPDMLAARRNMQLTASGAYEDPYATLMTLAPDNEWSGINVSDALDPMNPYVGGRTFVSRNRFEGMSPEYRAMKQSAMDDVVNNYNTAVRGGTNAAFNKAGAFHSGAYEAADRANKSELARNLGRLSSEMDVGQWDKSAGYEQQKIGLDVNSQLQDAARNLAGWQSWAGLQNQSMQQDVGRNAQLAEAGLDRGVQAQMHDTDRASNAWQQERARQMGVINPIMGANQFDQSNARNMIALGDMQRGYTTDLFNQDFQTWQDHVNYPNQMLNTFGSALSQASGNYGQSTSYQNSPMYRANPLASALGAGMLGMGAYNAWNA